MHHDLRRWMALLEGNLFEARLDFLRDKYIPLLLFAIHGHKVALTTEIRDKAENHWVQKTIGKRVPDAEKTALQNQTLAETLFDEIVATDPDVTKKNTQWLLNVILSGQSLVEDLPKAAYYLPIFQRVKHLLPVEARDLNRYKSFADLYVAIEAKEREMSKREADRQHDHLMHADEHATVIMNTPEYKIVIPRTEAASCHFGRNTQWCTTSAFTQNQFNTYNQEGPLYIILDKRTNRRWQYHFATGQFVDERDLRIDIPSFTAAHPEVMKVLNASLPKPIAYLTNDPVFKMPNGLVVRRTGEVDASPPILRLLIDPASGRFIGKEYGGLGGTMSADVAKLLNKLNIPGDPAAGTSDRMLNLYYRPVGGKRWQTIAEASKPLLKLDDGWVWKGIKAGGKFDLILVPKAYDRDSAAKVKGYACQAALDSEGTFRVTEVPIYPGVTSHKAISTRNNAVATSIGKYVVDLLLSLNGIKAWQGNDELSPSMLNQDDAKRLIDAKPFLGDIATVFKAKGVCPATKRMVLTILDGEEAAHTRMWVGDRLIVKEWPDIGKAMDDLATRNASKFYEYYIEDGGMNIDIGYYPEEVETYQRTDFLNTLYKHAPDDLTELGQYLAKQHPEYVESFADDHDDLVDEDEGESYDPSDPVHVAALLDDSDDDHVLRAMTQAISDGIRSATENAAFEMLSKAVEENEYLLFKRPPPKGRKRPIYDGKFVWDTPVVLAVPMAKIIPLLDYPQQLYGVSQWIENLEDATIDLEEPDRGFDGYDDEAAQEVFIEAIHEFLP